MKDIEVSSLSAIEHILANRPDRVLRLRVGTARHGPRIGALIQQAREHGIHVEQSGDSKAGRDREIEPISAWLAPYVYTELRDFIESVSSAPRSLVLALDHLQDPQNFGALCRTAEGLGVSAVIIPKDRGTTVGPGVYHASVGAVETIPIVLVANLGEALRRLKENAFWCLGTTLSDDATGIGEVPDFPKIVLVMGAELEGLSQGIEKQCDWRVKIPLSGRVQSLNVSVAGGILMHALMNR